MVARAPHAICWSGGIRYEVHLARVSGLIRKSPVLTLVDCASTTATCQVAIGIRFRACQWRLLLTSTILKSTVLLLLSFRGTLLLQRFLRFFLCLPSSLQALAHHSFPRDAALRTRSAISSDLPHLKVKRRRMPGDKERTGVGGTGNPRSRFHLAPFDARAQRRGSVAGDPRD
jgi:hypothetical protein